MITALSLQHYKNYTSEKISFHEGIHFFVGQNGMGKTNLLDAIYYICMAKSHNSTSDRDIVGFGQEFFRLEAKTRTGTHEHLVAVKVKPGEVKEIVVDGKPKDRLSGYVGFIPVIMLAPEDIVLIQGGSVARRRFMDIVMCQADRRYLEGLQRYNRLLAQRNALLKQHGRLADTTLLMTYSRSMSDAAAYIHQGRDALTRALLPDIMTHYDILSGSEEAPSLRYQSHMFTRDLEALAESSIEADMQNGRTTKGVHRDDIEILLDERPVKKYGSQGQIKSLLIALHLAQAAYLKRTTGTMPCLLLDDIFDKLDEDRSLRLIGLLDPEVATQVFITDASQMRVRRLISNADRPVFMYNVRHGHVRKVAFRVNDEENGNLQTYDEEE